MLEDATWILADFKHNGWLLDSKFEKVRLQSPLAFLICMSISFDSCFAFVCILTQVEKK